jgi:hypothetical protein
MAVILNAFDIVRLTLVSQLGPQVALNRYHYLVGAPVGSPTDTQFAFEFSVANGGLYRACLSSAATFRGDIAQIYRPLPTPAMATHFQVFQSQGQNGGAGVGTRGATPLPGQVRGLVGFKGNVAARGLNPRTYFPWPSTSDLGVDAYTPAAAYSTAIETFAQAVITFNALNDGAGNTCNLALVDFRVKQPANYVFEFLTSFAHRPRWATQRRSGAYGRPNLPPI